VYQTNNLQLSIFEIWHFADIKYFKTFYILKWPDAPYESLIASVCSYNQGLLRAYKNPILVPAIRENLVPRLQVFQTVGDRRIFGRLRFPGVGWYVVTVLGAQMLPDEKNFGNH